MHRAFPDESWLCIGVLVHRLGLLSQEFQVESIERVLARRDHLKLIHHQDRLLGVNDVRLQIFAYLYCRFLLKGATRHLFQLFK